MTTDSSATQSSRKRKRVSKNRKKSWLKHSDVTEIEDFLEDQRLQERTGGIAAEKANTELFFVDKDVDTTGPEEKTVGRKRMRIPKPLRCHAALLPNPKIPPARTPHNVPRGDPTRHLSKRVQAKMVAGDVAQWKRQASVQRQTAKKQARQGNWHRRQMQKVTYDLWEADLDAVGEDYYLTATKKKRAKVPSHMYEKPSCIPAVEVAHPGASYNPTFDDHQELMAKALLVEEKKEKVAKKLTRSLDEKFPKGNEAPTQETWIAEMSACLYEDGDGEETVGDDTPAGIDDPAAVESTSVSRALTVRREDKKSKKDRRKAQVIKKEEAKRKEQKALNRQLNDVYRLKSIKAEIRKDDNKTAERVNGRLDKKEQQKTETKKLGKLKYEPAPLEIKTSEELEGSLRLLKPEGNLLLDRFNSLQKRNIIETRLRAKFKRKLKVKYYEKKGHKEITL